MGKLQPIIWSKGTLLAPQHLQAQDRFIESSMHFRLDALAFRPWGFRELSIDHDKLTSGTFAITRASGMLADGLLFEMPESDPVPAAKPLAQAFEADQNMLEVYLAIPSARDGGPNVSTNAQSDTRYSQESSMLPDENSGMGERPIQLAKKNFRFLVGREFREGISGLKVAQVRRTNASTYEIDPQFIPPVLNYTSSEFLLSILRRQVEILSARSGVLASTRRPKDEALAAFSASDIPNFWLLYTINSYFPVLNHLYEMREGHPERLFAAMSALAGALTTFSRDMHPRDMPKYDHENLYPCFSDLDEKLRSLLNTVVKRNFVSLPMKLVQPSIYATSIAEDKYFAKTKMYLAISAEMKRTDFVANTLKLVKVGPANYVEHAVKVGIGGMPLTYIESPPDSLPVKLNYEYFALDQVGPAWEAIRRERHLAAYVPDDFPNPQLELLVVFI